MAGLRSGQFGEVRFLVVQEQEVYLNLSDMVERDFLGQLVRQFNVEAFQQVGKSFFAVLNQDLLTIRQDIIDVEEDKKPDLDNYEGGVIIKKEQHYIVEQMQDEFEPNVEEDFSDFDPPLRESVQNTDENSNKHECTHCEHFVGSSLKSLRAHESMHHKEIRRFKCDECDYRSDYKINVKRHVNTKHKGLQGDLCCTYCPKRFFSTAKLKSHILVHTDEKNFVCEECAAKFKRKDDLKAHHRIHDTAEIRAQGKAQRSVHTCDTCGKKFEKQWKLKRHMSVHIKRVNPTVESESIHLIESER